MFKLFVFLIVSIYLFAQDTIAITLRNIALTSPYFHNGTELALNEAIKSMKEIKI